MTTEAVKAELTEEKKKKRHRSPNYPAVGLKEAVERTAAYMKGNTMAAILPESAAKAIGFSSAHGTAMSVLAALKKYGLMEEKGGRVGPTKRAAEIVNLPKADERRLKAIRDAAMTPPLYKELFDIYRDTGIPLDDALMGELTTYKGFSPNAAKEFLKAFRETLDFAGLSDTSVLGSESGEQKPKFKIGDFVQWESNGVLQIAEAKRIAGFYDDDHAYLEGSSNGVPVAELIPADAPATEGFNPLPPIVKQPEIRVAAAKSGAVMRQDVFSLAEGAAVLNWPSPLSKSSIRYLKNWLELVKLKIEETEEGPRGYMEEQIAAGECIDVATIGTKVRPGVYKLEQFTEKDGKDYCDLAAKDWIRSIGRHKKTGEILASVREEFYGNSEYDCAWLR